MKKNILRQQKSIIAWFRFYFLSILNFFISKRNDMIVIYGRSMLNDNTEALLSYLVENNYYKKYKLVLVVRENVEHTFTHDVEVVTGSLASLRYILKAKYIFHAQGMSSCSLLPCKGQIIFNTWHGSPLKKIGKGFGGIYKGDSYYLSASPFYTIINKECFDLKDKQIFIGSNPRNDLLFNQTDIKKIWGWEDYRMIVLFMPTYRKSKDMNRLDADKEFPIITKDNISDFNNYLKQQGVLLVIKPHPYQDGIDFLKNDHTNIKVIYNKDIRDKGLKLYEFLGATDALLTDFSSVFFDYLLIDKPIGFTIDDMNSYLKGRGFVVDDPTSLMCGMKITNIDEMKSFINKLNNNADEYVQERHKIRDLTNSFTTPDASKRILEYVGITLD